MQNADFPVWRKACRAIFRFPPRTHPTYCVFKTRTPQYIDGKNFSKTKTAGKICHPYRKNLCIKFFYRFFGMLYNINFIVDYDNFMLITFKIVIIYNINSIISCNGFFARKGQGAGYFNSRKHGTALSVNGGIFQLDFRFHLQPVLGGNARYKPIGL